MREFEDQKSLKKFLKEKSVSNIAIQGVNLKKLEKLMLSIEFKDCLLLGCKMTDKLYSHLYKDNYILPYLDAPFNAYPNRLYNADSLYAGYDHKHPTTYSKTPDKTIYEYYLQSQKHNSIKDTLIQRLHDHSITDALEEFINKYEEKKIVAIMGGHSLSRTDPRYRQAVEISKALTEKGYLMVSGGGPGAMEATHLGAWCAGGDVQELENAFEILSTAPTYNHPDWLRTAFEVLTKWDRARFKSLGIPTWHYGHEPPTPFATHIAKYFANSVREEGLLAIAKGGIIFAPGSAGTIQEIFQDIAQNHYESFGYASPMIFLDKLYWCYERPVYPAIELMHVRGNLKNLNLGLYDTNDEVIKHIEDFK